MSLTRGACNTFELVSSSTVPRGTQYCPDAKGMAQIELHLTFGCEVALDVTHAHVSKLEDVQNEYLRRLLGLNRRSVLAILFSETGIGHGRG
jgi:hypothetical protein